MFGVQIGAAFISAFFECERAKKGSKQNTDDTFMLMGTTLTGVLNQS
jgi:hypothetical protein